MEHGNTANNGSVIFKAAVSMEFHKFIKNSGDIVKSGGSVCLSGKKDCIPGTLFCVFLRLCSCQGIYRYICLNPVLFHIHIMFSMHVKDPSDHMLLVLTWKDHV